MPVAACQVLGDKVAAGAEVNQPDFGSITDDDLAIGSLQGRTGDNSGLPPGTLAVDPAGHGFQPGPAILIGERNAGMHFGDVGFGMKGIAFLEGPTDPRCKRLRNGGLSNTGHPHNDQDRRAAPMAVYAFEAHDPGCIADEDRTGPANKKAAFHHPDHAANALLEPAWVGNWSEAAIEDAVATVGDERLTRRLPAQASAGTKNFQRRLGRFQTEGNNL